MSGRPDAPRDVLDSEPNVGEESGLSGGMGVSSERVGKVRGSSEPKTTGAEDLHIEAPAGENEEEPPDQLPG